MRNTRKNGLIMAMVAVLAILAMGATAVSAGIGGMKTDLPFLAQNGNGNGGRRDENPPFRPGTGNSGQGQGAENGNPPADPGSGNNRQGTGQGEEDVAIPDAPESGEMDGADEAVDAEVPPVKPVPEKMDVCHVDDETGETILITISSRAVPAHQRHGDKIDADTIANCGVKDIGGIDEAAAAAPAGEEATGGDDAVAPEDGTPVASPAASPEADEDND